MENLPDRGGLEALPLPRLLLALQWRRFGGRLTLSRDRIVKQLTWRDGAPVLADSSRASEGLAARLRDSGRLAPEQAAQVTEHARQRKVRQEAALLELKLLAPKELLAALREQVRHLLLECFAWSGGSYALEPEEAGAEAAALLRVDPLGLVREGLETRWSPERLLAGLAPQLGRYPVPVPACERELKRLACDPGARALLDALDGRRTLDEAIRAAGGPSGLAAAWLLDAAGVLAYHDEPAAPPAAPEAGEERSVAAQELEIVVSGAGAAPATVPDDRDLARRPAASDAKTSEAETLRRQIEEKIARLDELDHYGVLGIARDAKPAQVKRAYFTAAKHFHPDALGRLGLDELRPQASEVFARMAKAYEVLSDFERRRDYDGSLGGDDDADAARLVQAETMFRKGEVLLRAGNFRGALEFLGPAVQLWPDDAAYAGSFGWALYKADATQAKQALPHLERAVQLAPEEAVGHQRLGVVLRALDRTEEAERAFARARQLGPKKGQA